MKLKLSIFAIFFLVLLNNRTAVFAKTEQPIQQVLSISPAIFDVNIAPGKTQTYELKIQNLLGQPLGIRISAEGFSAADEQNEVNFGKDDRTLSWINFDQSEFILSEKEKRTVQVSLNNPKNLKEGGYYAVIFFTPFYSRPVEPGAPTIVSRVGALFLATNGKINYSDLKSKVSIQTTGVPLFNEDANINLSLRVRNNYFTHFTAKPFLKIEPLWGDEKSFELDNKRVLPGKSRIWYNKIPSNISNGIYKSTVSVSIGNGIQLEKSSYFVIFPYKLVVYPLLIVGAAAILLLGRRRIKKALQTLLK